MEKVLSSIRPQLGCREGLKAEAIATRNFSRTEIRVYV